MAQAGYFGLIAGVFLLFSPIIVTAQSPFRYLPLPETISQTIKESVDIVIEPMTHTPYFYQGRAEPISGSKIKLVAIPHNDIAGSNLTYRWYLNGKSLSQTPTSEAKMMLTTLPVGQRVTVKVEVLIAGSIVAAKTETIPLSNMELALYENNALRGMSRIAITNDVILIGDEITILAVPYFSNKESLGGGLKTYWKIDRQDQPPALPWQLTIERKNLDRDALINFVMQDHQTMQSAEASFTLKL